jgi:hypothetical protein
MLPALAIIYLRSRTIYLRSTAQHDPRDVDR